MRTNVVYCGDCIQGLKKLPDKSVDCIITDPPYGIDKEGVINDNNLDEYYKSLPEMNRVLKDDSWIVVFTYDKQIPNMFKNNPFEFMWIGIIYYPNMARFVYSPLGCSKKTTFMLFKKGNPKRHTMIRDVIKCQYPFEKCYGHPTPKPLNPLRMLVKNLSNENDIILDPFGGSGTTYLACKQTKRRWVGFEISPEYCKIIEKRLSQKVMTGFFDTQAHSTNGSLNSDLTGNSAEFPQILPLAELR